MKKLFDIIDFSRILKKVHARDVVKVDIMIANE